LTEAGEYSTVGRYREPDKDDIATMEASLSRAGLSGWLAIMGGSAHDKTPPQLVMVRPLCNPRTSFDAAVQAFLRRRHAAAPTN
jgi:hypothetical protein